MQDWPNFRAPLVTPAEKWRATEQPRFVGEPLDKVEWWKGFNDPQLDSLVQQTFKQNLTLQRRPLRVVQARIGKVMAAEFLLPIHHGRWRGVRTKFSQTITPDVR